MSEKKTEIEKRNILRLSNEESNKLTRECLQTALIQLMSEKDLSRISITELVSRAGVSRTAFYSNYSSKEEVLASWLSDFIDEISELSKDAVLKDAVTKEELSDMYRRLFERIRQNKDSFSVLIKANLQEMLYSRIEERILHLFPSCDVQTSYVLTAWCGAFCRILIRWVNEDMTKPFDEGVAVCEEISEYVLLKMKTE